MPPASGCCKLAAIASGSLELGPQVLQTRLDGVGCKSFCTELRSVDGTSGTQPTLRERVRREEIHQLCEVADVSATRALANGLLRRV
jgi:hypothetical protein